MKILLNIIIKMIMIMLMITIMIIIIYNLKVSVQPLHLPTCAKYVLPSCREGSPYVFLLQIFEVFQPVVLYTDEHFCSPVRLCC